MPTVEEIFRPADGEAESALEDRENMARRQRMER